jgi:carbamate kinase
VTGRGIVIALGGNALAPAGEKGTVAQQFRHARESLGAVVELAAQGWRIALVHGNGPQVGDFLVQQEMAREAVPPLPLGVLVAATEGWIGYMLQQSLENALARAGVERQVVTVVTQVLVDPADPALAAPDKPIGRTMSEAEARRMREERGWSVARTASGWRRVVASPRPIGIVEREMIRTLVAEGHLVIAAGGGGTPVYRDEAKGLEGVDAVVDKDRAAAALASDIGASLLLILTDVDGVYAGYGTPEQRRIERLTVSQARRMLADGVLGSGSMAPKVEAAIRFLAEGGERATIARLDRGGAAVAGRAGTEIVPDEAGPPAAARNEPQGVE